MQWVDNLIHLLCFLHNEGVKLQPKLEKSSSCAKSSSISELENTNCHDDAALFGDLFSEGGRSVGSNDGYKQVPSVNPLTGSYEMIIQAAAEIFIFLKSCVFSPEWCAPVYEDACKKLGRDHIDSLLAMLGSQICYCYDGFDGGPGVHEQSRIE
ncbi:hypothetical protein BVRB_5g106340 [Beta vulgaris subsp. vulgaris]|uniref:auxin transport protein BIG-like n=1 Tax=Beta vulgaris subsp. vulgaris TaxID=3555 RepID=UPI00065C5EEA|nr:auxin transport protein BIG-like [Beta vulgaris subsp. vulgaris]KMT11697.1 hypothetical protein BVRB_5g106340 [Beta vulgaris subsp. vulgaris]